LISVNGIVRGIAGLAIAVLAACSSDTGLLTGASVTSEPAATVAGATVDARSAFKPFAGTLETEVVQREVIVNPTVHDVMLTGLLPEMAYGRPDAPVTLIKYMSLTCPHCRRFQADVYPVLKREYIDTGKVRLILREFPIGKASGTATIALRCTDPDKYLTLYEKFLNQQAAWVAQDVKTDAIFAVAAQVGMTRQQFDSCLQNRGMINALNAVKERGRTLGVIGTPNFFVNARLIKSTMGVKEMRELVDAALAGRIATTAGAPVPAAVTSPSMR
jgi:protein-disulfide isomerase